MSTSRRRFSRTVVQRHPSPISSEASKLPSRNSVPTILPTTNPDALKQRQADGPGYGKCPAAAGSVRAPRATGACSPGMSPALGLFHPESLCHTLSVNRQHPRAIMGMLYTGPAPINQPCGQKHITELQRTIACRDIGRISFQILSARPAPLRE